MTDTQLDRIETELGLRLPADYRAVSQEFPFRTIGNERVYWFYDDPNSVIQNTRVPMSDGDYDMANWNPTYLIIGRGAAGDEHLIDTALAHSSVYLLSHEDHSIVEEWPSLSAFVEDWNKQAEQSAWAEADHTRKRKIQSQQTGHLAWAMLTIVLVCIALIVLMIRSPH